MEKFITERIRASAELKSRLSENEILIKALKDAAQICLNSLQNGGRIFFCGNGGSAADAQHLAAELSGRFYYDRKPLAAEALHTNASFLTAVANDYGYEEIFSRLLEGNGRQGDVLISLTTSGNSGNILNALDTASRLHIHTILFSGETGGKARTKSEVCLLIPSSDTARIQESHILLGHILCEDRKSTL